ncbi:MAG: hypothetical protein K9L86_03385 [Candidatus Omnitrophica bacterium]|nr:hypothetical protein [Candidatus Omnitrophota bacterium]
MSSNNKPLVLILCGGRSLRLWPLSQYKSKNFLDVFGFSPLELTVKRFLKITPKENIFLVANISEKKELEKLKIVRKANIIFEPQSKNTAAAVLLSILHLKNQARKSIIIAPVDHLIEKEKEFYKALNLALAAAQAGSVCTLGIKPNEPTPNFGYIQVKSKQKGSYPIRRFIEKPSPSRAKKLIAKGGCFYNSGIFVASLATLIDEYKKYYPDYNHFIRLFAKKKIKSLYRGLENKPFDKAIMEKTKKGALVKGNFSWKDFGSWLSIYEVFSKDGKGNVSRGKSFMKDSRNNLVFLNDLGKKILVIGMEDTFLIDTKDFILLANRAHINSLKKALKQFKH